MQIIKKDENGKESKKKQKKNKNEGSEYAIRKRVKKLTQIFRKLNE